MLSELRFNGNTFGFQNREKIKLNQGTQAIFLMMPRFFIKYLETWYGFAFSTYDDIVKPFQSLTFLKF